MKLDDLKQKLDINKTNELIDHKMEGHTKRRKEQQILEKKENRK